MVKLLIQPQDGVEPLLAAIRNARKSIEIVIFRFDQRDIESTLKAAAARGVHVHALIAHTNGKGEKSLRKLEMRLLEAGVTVARTADDLLRYHAKFMIVDRRVLYILAFNLTSVDILRSRSFGIITTRRPLVQEAARLFEADIRRQPYVSGLDTLIVSPVNARRHLAAFLRRARKQLLIYDGELSDSQMVRILQRRRRAGVELRVLGRMDGNPEEGGVRKLQGMRFHTRTIIRDGRLAFIGSQSLRKLELDGRREVGVIVRDPVVVKALIATFEGDWLASDAARGKSPAVAPTIGAARGFGTMPAAPVAIDKDAVKEVVKEVVKHVVAQSGDQVPEADEMKEALKEALKEAVKEVVLESQDKVASG